MSKKYIDFGVTCFSDLIARIHFKTTANVFKNGYLCRSTCHAQYFSAPLRDPVLPCDLQTVNMQLV